MINLTIKNFKCFSDKIIRLNRLSLLVGANGVGKSTVIQAILLLRSTFVPMKKEKEKVGLNDNFMMLGTADGVLCQSANEQAISLSLENDEDKSSIYCKYSIDNYDNQLELSIDNISQNGESILKRPYFYYLCAERIGPRVSQPLQYLPYINVGCNGQYTAQVLSHSGGMLKIEEDRMFEDTKNRNLQAQVNAWLSKILPGIEISAAQDLNSLQAQIKIKKHGNNLHVLAPNIGFGISYVLPIITTGLTAEKNSLFIVENPEAHLHPAAQSAIGEFLGMVAQSGVYVLVETHSDHVVNGIQLYVAKHKRNHDKVTILNFSSNQKDMQPSVEVLTMNECGELSDWPEGFFDQAQIDFMELQKLRGKNV